MRSHQVKYVKRQVVRPSSAKDSLLSALSKMRRIERVSITGTPLAAVDEVSHALAPLISSLCFQLAHYLFSSLLFSLMLCMVHTKFMKGNSTQFLRFL